MYLPTLREEFIGEASGCRVFILHLRGKYNRRDRPVAFAFSEGVDAGGEIWVAWSNGERFQIMLSNEQIIAHVEAIIANDHRKDCTHLLDLLEVVGLR